MYEKQKILITGSTGNVGLATLKSLIKNYKKQVDGGVKNIDNEQEVELYAGVRDIIKGEAALGEFLDKIKLVKFDLNNMKEIEEVLRTHNFDKALLIRPPQLANIQKYFTPLIKSFAQNRLKHVVLLSVQGAQKLSFLPHSRIEKLILSYQLSYTFLRPSFFMQNLTQNHAREIREEDKLIIPSGRGKTNFIDVEDIGEVAATALIHSQQSQFKNQALELTGSESFDYYQVAKMLSHSLEREITYTNPSIVQYITYHIKKRTDFAMIIFTLLIYQRARFGKAADYSPILEKILNRKPVQLQDFIEKNKEILTKLPATV
jgi:uncharacterized protein YbjT (DUF2867 family)